MQKRLDYKCPLDIRKMPKIDGTYFCDSCEKNVHDLTRTTDFQVRREIFQLGISACISIQQDRLSLVTKRISKWQLFIFLLVNFKSFFLQKVFSQMTLTTTTSTTSTDIVTRTLKGKVMDDKTGKPVKNATIELYKFNIFINQVKGDESGNFVLSVMGSKFSDTISLKITSPDYAGTAIKNLPLKKLKSTLEAKIPKNGPVPEIGLEENVVDPWTGRLME